MTKAESRKIEIRLRARGVYKPYVSVSDGVLAVESYPLTVYVQAGPCDPEMGPVTCLKLNDCTLPRIGQDATITTRRIFIGQDVETHVAQLLMDFHAPAYERAKEQERVLDAQVVAVWAR